MNLTNEREALAAQLARLRQQADAIGRDCLRLEGMIALLTQLIAADADIPKATAEMLGVTDAPTA